MLTNLMLNKLAKPDFIAYKFADREHPVLRTLVDKKGYNEVSWTVQTPEEFRTALRGGSVPIFEHIAPEDLKEIIQEDK